MASVVAQTGWTMWALRASAAACVIGATLGAGPARADPGQTTWTTYLYSGPGQRYKVLDEVPQQQELDIRSCRGGWCEVAYSDRVGFVLAEVVIHADQNALKPPQGVLAQPAANLEPHPEGPCFKANQKGGNGGNELSEFCQR